MTGAPSDHAGRWAANGLRVTGWLAVNALVALGMLAGLAVVLGNFSLSGTLLQLANLAAHFAIASPQHQTQFAHLLLAIWATGFVGVGLFRRASLLDGLECERAHP
jgi:hypothetical protein